MSLAGKWKGTSPLLQLGARFVKALAVNHDKNCVFPWNHLVQRYAIQQVRKPGYIHHRSNCQKIKREK